MPASTETATPAPSTRAPATRRWRLLKYDELDEWRRDNAYIRTGYAPLQNCWTGTARATLRLHNESVNIWTHLLGALAFVLLSVWLLTSNSSLRPSSAPFTLVSPFASAAQPRVSWPDTLSFFVFAASAVFCLGVSATFHASTCHSQAVSTRLNRGDYIGIAVLIWGSNVPCLQLGFYCHPTLKYIFTVLVSTAGLAAVLTVLRAPSYRDDAYRRKRTWTFIAFGLSAVLPIAVAVYLYGAAECRKGFGLGHPLRTCRKTLSKLTGQITGALLYAERVPERFHPGRYDLFGRSCQLMTQMMLTVAATYSSCWPCGHIARGALIDLAHSPDTAVAEAWRYRHIVMQGSCGLSL